MAFRWPLTLLWVLASWSWMASTASTDDPSIRRIPLRSQSLAAPYLDSDMQSRYFEFGEDTIIRADQYIRLASDRQGQNGWLFARMPMTANNWELEMEFKIHGEGHLHGDGMAIWLTEERAQSGKVFGSRDNFNGLGVFIDTYKNGRAGVTFPYVMAMLGNSSVSYDKDHDGKENELAGCSAKGIRGEGDPHFHDTKKIRLTYFQDVSFRVDLQYKKAEAEEWTECFETAAIKLPQTVFLGFSAETGELSDNFDIIKVDTHNMHVRSQALTRQGQQMSNSEQDSKPREAHPYNPGGDKERGSWRWFFLKIVLFGIVVVGGYVGWTMYRASKRTRF